MKKFKISIYIFIILSLFIHNNVMVAADDNCTTTYNQTTIENTLAVTSSTGKKLGNEEVGGLSGNCVRYGSCADSYERAYLQYGVYDNYGNYYTGSMYTNGDNKESALKYDSNAIDLSGVVDGLDVISEGYNSNGNWSWDTTEIGEKFSDYANTFVSNDELTPAGREFYRAIMGDPNASDSEIIDKFGHTNLHLKTTYNVKHNDDGIWKELAMTIDNMNEISGHGLDPIMKALENSMIDQTDGSESLGLGGTATVILLPDQKSNNRKVTICEDCGDPNDPSFPNAPEPPTPPEMECPPHYSCEQRFGTKVCNGAKTRACGNASTKGGDCGGFSYQEDSNVMYCANKIGMEVPGTAGLSHYYCYEYGAVSAPSTPSTVFANRGFNLNGSFSATETRVCVKDDGANIWAKYAKQMTLYLNAQADVACKQKEIEKQEKYIEELEYYLSGLRTALQTAQSINCGSCTKGSCSGSCGGLEGEALSGCQSSLSTCQSDVDKAYQECQEKVSKCEADKANTISSLEDSIKDAEDKISLEKEYLEKLQEELKALQAIADAYLALAQQAAGYLSSYAAAEGNIVTTSNSISVTPPIAKFGEYTMMSGQVNAINKNSATFGKIENEQNSLPLNFQFYVPNVANNTSGNVSSFVSGIGINLNLSYDWSCDFNILNFVRCTHDDCIPNSGPGSYKLIFRPISLTEPFPNSREPGANWTEEMSEKIIKNNRNVSDYEVYNLEPMYTIKLTPSDIKDIRAYNNQNSYNSFDEMECSNGIECRSTFLTDSSLFSTPISGCGMSSDWNACFSDSLSDYKAGITTGINEKKNVASLFKEGVEH